MFYLNPYKSLCINSEIIEYDIKSANLSIIKEYKLLSQDIIDKIEKMNKNDRVIFVGKIMGKDKNFAKTLEKKFNDIIDEFIELNHLDKELDVISIKRDAVFVINKNISHTKFGEHINFIRKNVYTAYMYLKPYEFYINNDKIDVKGLNDQLYNLHKNGILDLIREFIELCASTNMNKSLINRYLKSLVVDYKNRNLCFDYYREFNQTSKYRYIIDDEVMLVDSINERSLNRIDISYNYINIIIPMIRLII